MDRNQLVAAINLAAEEGRADVVVELTQKLRELDSAPTPDSGPPPGGPQIAQEPETPEYRATDDMGSVERFLAGMGRSAVAMGQGAKQLYKHAAPWVSSEEAERYDAQVQEDKRIFDKDLGQTGAGMAGKITGDIALTAVPGGAAARGVQAVSRLGQGAKGMMAGQAGAGAMIGALQPTDTQGREGFWEQKAAQAGTGAAISAGATGAFEVLRRGFPALMNAPGTLYNKLAGQADSATPGPVARAADELGVDLPMGARTGSKGGIMAENLARQSIVSMDKAFRADQRIAGQVVNTVNRLMSRIGQGGTRGDVGRAVQRATSSAINHLANRREQLAAPLWRKLDQMGIRAVPMRQTQQTIQRTLDEYRGVIGSEATAIRGALGDLLEQITKADDGAMTLRALVKNRREMAKAAAGVTRLLGSDVGIPTQRMIAAKVLKSIENDLDGAADLLGGEAGGVLKAANAIWRQYSQGIKAIERSPLGRLLGDEFEATLATGNFNSIPGDVVLDRLFKLDPASMKLAVRILDDADPVVLNQVRRQFIQDAMDSAMSIPPSSGQNVIPFIPSKFIGKMGYTPKDNARLYALFGPRHLNDLMKVRSVVRAWGDQTGRNFSGTAPANEAIGLFNTMASGGKSAILSAFGRIVGTRRIADAMADPQGARYVREVLTAPERAFGVNLPLLEKKASYVLALIGAQGVDNAGNPPGYQ